MKDSQTAAALIIGNEILGGKIRDENVYALALTLRELGVNLARVVIIADEIETISCHVRELARDFDYLFTSGGVGPTHDDLTISGVAQAFDVAVVRDPEVEKLLRNHYGSEVSENHLKMADVPEGARTLYARSPWPLIVVRNVWVLPGIPEIFRMKLAIVREHLQGGAPFVTRALYSKQDEAFLKPLLDRVVANHPEVNVGSYPRWNDPSYETKITFDGRDENAILSALSELESLLPEGEPLWTE
jgi:molybdenum cofactor synthesis domain-containing protein